MCFGQPCQKQPSMENGDPSPVGRPSRLCAADPEWVAREPGSEGPVDAQHPESPLGTSVLAAVSCMTERTAVDDAQESPSLGACGVTTYSLAYDDLAHLRVDACTTFAAGEVGGDVRDGS